MIKDEIKKYIISQTEFQVPFVQNMFSVSYPEMKEVLDELIKERKIEFVSGMTYKVIYQSAQLYKPADDMEALYIKILWSCIKGGSAYTFTVQRRFNIGYAAAARAIDWLEDNGYVSPYPERSVLITEEDFIRKFGPVDEQLDPSERGSGMIERHRQSKLWDLYFPQDRDDDDDDNEDDDDISDILDMLNGDDEKSTEKDDGEDGEYDFKSALIEAFGNGLKVSGSDGFTIGFSDGMQFELKFVNDGNALRISDGGKTLFGSTLTRRKVTDVLNDFAPAVLEENGEISVKVEMPADTLMSLLTLYAAVSAVKKIK